MSVLACSAHLSYFINDDTYTCTVIVFTFNSYSSLQFINTGGNVYSSALTRLGRGHCSNGCQFSCFNKENFWAVSVPGLMTEPPATNLKISPLICMFLQAYAHLLILLLFAASGQEKIKAIIREFITRYGRSNVTFLSVICYSPLPLLITTNQECCMMHFLQL